MSKFSARYARKVQYCDIACRARRKNAIFLTFAPPIRNMDRRPCRPLVIYIAMILLVICMHILSFLHVNVFKLKSGK